MTDAILAIAPQTTGIENKVEQGSSDTSKYDSRFSDVLGTTIKDDEQDQAKDAGQTEDQAIGFKDDKQADAQVVRQEDNEKTDSSDTQTAVQMIAFLNAQVPLEVQQTGAVVDSSVSVEMNDVLGSGCISSGSVMDIVIAEAVSDVTSGESLRVASIGQSSQSMTLEKDAAVLELTAQNQSEITETAANAMDVLGMQEAAESLNVGDAITAQSRSEDSTLKASQIARADSESVSVSKNAESIKAQVILPKANQTCLEQKTSLDTSSQTKIEVTASTEPPREFTIKPQVLSPVVSHIDGTGTMISEAVSRVASTDNGGVNADTSGSQDSQVAAFTLQNSASAAVRQTAQTQSTQTVPKTEQPLHTQIIDQIVRDVKLIKLPQQNDLVVRLTPPELGTLRVQISQAEQGMTAQIQTSGDQVRGLLQAHLPALNQAFSDAGLKMNSVTVTSNTSFSSLMQDSTNGSAQQQWGSQKHHYTSSQDASLNQTVSNLSAGVADGESTTYNWLA